MDLPRELARLRLLEQATGGGAPPWGSLEELLTAPALFGLTTASHLQRALCRVIDGAPLGELGAFEEVRRAFGDVDALPASRVHELAIISGIRSGKSLLIAAAAVHLSQIVDVSRVGPGEVPRVAIVSTSKDNAAVIFEHLEGRIRASERLSQIIIGRRERGDTRTAPGSRSLLVRHPSGRPIEIRVVAGSRAGSALTSRWMVAVIFDEFPRMVGASEGVINWDAERRASLERILPGGMMFHVGSPWAPTTPAAEMVAKYGGKPTKNLVVAHAPSYAMWPQHWTPERIAEAKEHDIDAYLTDVEALFASPAEAMFSSASVDAAVRDVDVRPREYGATYGAAMDPATRGNGWTLCIGTRIGAKRIIAYAREWRGSKAAPLDPYEVMEEIREVLETYGVKVVETDQWSADFIVAWFRKHKITVLPRTWTSTETAAAYQGVSTKIDAGEIELPPESMLLTDLKRVQKRPGSRGGMSVALPKTRDGRHCDFAPSIVLVLDRWCRDSQPFGAESKLEDEATRMKKARLELVKSSNETQRHWSLRMPMKKLAR